MLKLKLKAKKREGDRQVLTFNKKALVGASLGELLGFLASSQKDSAKASPDASEYEQEVPAH
jgi:hypothetical protein